MNTELKQRKTVVHRKRSKPAETAHPEEVRLLSFPGFHVYVVVTGGTTEDMGKLSIRSCRDSRFLLDKICDSSEWEIKCCC